MTRGQFTAHFDVSARMWHLFYISKVRTKKTVSARQANHEFAKLLSRVGRKS
jgi:hypothetical protein